MPPDIYKLLRYGKFELETGVPEGPMSKQWLLEHLNTGADPVKPITTGNHLEFLVCGSNAFPRIVADIQAAKKSVDLICWGFDPGMEVGVRSGSEWPRGLTYGDLLRQTAERGVTVRLLVWYNALANVDTKNLWGYSERDRRDKPLPNLLASKQIGRSEYCREWWRQARTGEIPNLHVRHRDIPGNAVDQNQAEELAGYTFLEREGMTLFASHHQKPVLIDYELAGSAAVGYVMGLNSTTDYWDTPQHLYDDPLRGHAAEGHADGKQERLKPYRDYALRVQGEALFCLNRNFVTAWDRARTNWDPVHAETSLENARLSIARHQLSPPQGRRLHTAQIVRTQPEEQDKTIQDMYWLVAAQARNYLYIENQYFQYLPWVNHLKNIRRAYLKQMEQAGHKERITDLYVFVVMPEPEKSGMVPRTYDSVAALGQGRTMANYDTEVQQWRKDHPDPGKPVWAEVLGTAATSLLGTSLFPMGVALKMPQMWQQALLDSARQTAVSAADLEMLGIKVLIAKLYTQGSQRRCRPVYIHSKLLIADDAFFTLGSANLNVRSMTGDSEINIACQDKELPKTMRKTVWGNLAGEELDGSGENVEEAFAGWAKTMQENADALGAGDALQNFIVTFSDDRAATGLVKMRVAQITPAEAEVEVANA